VHCQKYGECRSSKAAGEPLMKYEKIFIEGLVSLCGLALEMQLWPNFYYCFSRDRACRSAK
jgi:hypothetical protein